MVLALVWHLPGKVVALHLDNSTAKTYFTKVVPYDFFQNSLVHFGSSCQAWYNSYSTSHIMIIIWKLIISHKGYCSEIGHST